MIIDRAPGGGVRAAVGLRSPAGLAGLVRLPREIFMVELKLSGGRSRQMRASLRRAAGIATVVVSSVVILAGRVAAAGSPDWIDWNGAIFLVPARATAASRCRAVGKSRRR